MASRIKVFQRPLDSDMIEKAILVVMFSLFAARMIASFVERGAAVDLLFLIDQAVLIGFVLVRRRTEAISRKPLDWLLGFAGTCLPLLLVPASGSPPLPMVVCVLLMLSGFATHLAAKLTLRRSFGVVAANRGIKASGPYRIVRHPMYAGYLLTHVGLLLSGPNLTNAAVLAVTWALQVGRILVEERILRQDPAYADLIRQTRFRMIPGLF